MAEKKAEKKKAPSDIDSLVERLRSYIGVKTHENLSTELDTYQRLLSHYNGEIKVLPEPASAGIDAIQSLEATKSGILAVLRVLEDRLVTGGSKVKKLNATYAAVRSLYDRAVREAKELSDHVFDKAVTAEKKGETQEAKRLYSHAIILNPEIGGGLLLFQLGEEAVKNPYASLPILREIVSTLVYSSQTPSERYIAEKVELGMLPR